MTDGDQGPGLSGVEREALEARLETGARELLAEIAECEEAEALLRSDCDLDAADAGARSDSEGRLRDRVRQARLRLGQTETALAHLREGTFGMCVRCCLPIGRERLLTRPTAELCVDCQALHESGRRAEG